MRTFIFIFLQLCSFISVCQTKAISLTRENLAQPKAFGRGAMLQVSYDSIIVYDNSRHQASLAAFQSTLKHYALIRQQYDSCQAEAAESSRKLSALTVSLITSVKQTLDSAGTGLNATRRQLDLAVNSLSVATANLKSVELLLKEERKQSRKKTLAWGFGGFSAGILATSLLFLALK